MIFLVGLPGTGKSTAGRSLARRLNVPWIDADHVVETRAGLPITEYFRLHGEDAFRDREEETLDEISQGGVGVVSTGGGAVLRQANRQRMRERGTVIYLRSSPEHLFRRLRHDTKRPLLQVADPLKRLRELHAQRDPLYSECAHFVVDTQDTTLAMLVNRILMQLELMPTPKGDSTRSG